MTDRHYRLELPTDLGAIEPTVHELADHGRELGFDPDRLRLNLRVGVAEALTNAMLYGNSRDPSKRVWLEAELSREAVVVRVTDEGRGFDPQHLPDPTLPPNRLRPGGRGIFLIRKLMDHVEFNEQGNSVTMVLYNRSSPPAGAGPGGAEGDA